MFKLDVPLHKAVESVVWPRPVSLLLVKECSRSSVGSSSLKLVNYSPDNRVEIIARPLNLAAMSDLRSGV